MTAPKFVDIQQNICVEKLVENKNKIEITKA